jgi:hypothetical protein
MSAWIFGLEVERKRPIGVALERHPATHSKAIERIRNLKPSDTMGVYGNYYLGQKRRFDYRPVTSSIRR